MNQRLAIPTIALLLLVGCTASEDSDIPRMRDGEAVDERLSEAFERWGYFTQEEKDCDSGRALIDLVATELNDPAAMHWSLDSFSTHSDIIIANNKMVRILWWLAPCSGSWHQTPGVVLVKSNGAYGVTAVPGEIMETGEGLTLGGVRELHHLRDSLYLNLSRGQLSGALPFERAMPFVMTPDTVYQADLPFHVDTRTFGSLTLDKGWYLDNLEANNYVIPTLLTYDSESRTLSFPTIRDPEGKRLFSEVYGISSGVTADDDDPIYLKFVDSAFIEVER